MEEELEKLRRGMSSDWWTFPTEGAIRGFMGTGPIFLVGDQPSMDQWPIDHPSRRAFYGTLQKVGLSNAHLTDFCKRRGVCSELRNKPLTENELKVHLAVLRKEIEILQPKRIVAVGELAQELLSRHLPEHKPIPRMWHFSYVVRSKRLSEYAKNMREAIES